MISIYIFLLTVKIICITLAGYFRLRLAFFKNTDTYSNICFVCGYAFALVVQALFIYDINISFMADIQWVVILSQLLGACIWGAFLMGTLRVYALSKPKI